MPWIKIGIWFFLITPCQVSVASAHSKSHENFIRNCLLYSYPPRLWLLRNRTSRACAHRCSRRGSRMASALSRCVLVTRSWRASARALCSAAPRGWPGLAGARCSIPCDTSIRRRSRRWFPRGCDARTSGWRGRAAHSGARRVRRNRQSAGSASCQFSTRNVGKGYRSACAHGAHRGWLFRSRDVRLHQRPHRTQEDVHRLSRHRGRAPVSLRLHPRTRAPAGARTVRRLSSGPAISAASAR